MSLGRMNQAVEEIRRAQQADPLSLIINTDVGEILFHNQQYVEAIAQERRTLEMNSDFPLAWGILALSYTQVHDYAKAIDALRSGMKAPGGEVLLMGTLGVTYALMRQDRLARAVLHRLTEKAERSHTEELYLSIAEIYSALGNKDQAFLWLEKDYRNRDGGLTLIKVTPPFDSLHSDPRFADFSLPISDHRKRDRHCSRAHRSRAEYGAVAGRHFVVRKRDERSCSGNGHRYRPGDDGPRTAAQASDPENSGTRLPEPPHSQRHYADEYGAVRY